MTSRRPNTANDAGPSRMPFASAEALLWGPEMKKQHAYLLTEMRTLQKQQKEYDARIRTTEAVTEVAQATTTRIHDLEQQLAALEAKDDNKAFEEWTSGEITRLGVFAHTTKNLEQKQSELDTKVSHVSEKLDRFLHENVDIEDVLRRLDRLERDRRADVERIQALEKEVDRLRSVRESDASCPIKARVGVEYRREARRDSMPSQKLDAEIAGTTIISDDEESLLPRAPLSKEIQVPQSPEVQEINPGDTVLTAPAKDRSLTSARQRLLQRPSIHNAKLPRPMEEQNVQPSADENAVAGLYHSSPPPTQLVSRGNWQSKPAAELEPQPTPLVVPASVLLPTPAPVPQHQTHGNSKSNTRTNEAPPTQLVERKPPGKRKQPDCGPQTQRQTRSQAKKNQAKEEEELQATTRASVVPEIQLAQKIEPVSPPRKRLKATPAKQRAGNKAKSSRASQAASRSTRKTQNQYKVEEPSEQEPIISAKSASTSTRLRKTKTVVSRKKTPTPAPPPVSMNPRAQKRLIVKFGPRQQAQEDMDLSQKQICASYFYCYDEL